MADDLDPLERHLLQELALLPRAAEPREADDARAMWRAQVDSRLVDHAARWLQSRQLGYYTIGSAGHEANAAVALALRVTDPALLHYRSGGFYLARSGQAGHDGVVDILLGMVAAADEPIAGGRHKVFGHADLAVIPQTSTIASHLPRAVGLALALDRAARMRVESPWPADSLVVASIGDASLNHATAQAALNTAAHCAHQRLPLPLLLVCEDNGIGISVPTPAGWVESALRARPQLRLEQADGDDPERLLALARELAAWVRETRRPAVLHLRVVRYLSHGGADLETAYRPIPAIREEYARDPILATARWLTACGAAAGEELAADYLSARTRIRELALEATKARPLETAAEVMRPLAPRSPAAVAAATARPWAPSDRLTLAQAINHGLADALEHRPETLLFGQDVAVKGGVYGVTRGLHARFGAGRVFDTLLDETSILGLALGAGLAGFVPIPEIQYLAYLHNAEDQLRGEAATLQFFSQGRFRNGMVVRVAGYGYQSGFGGHFHNDDAVGVLRDIPGLIVASPSRPEDAASMLRTCVAAAAVDGSVCVFLEPIALYHTRDLYEGGDGHWTAQPTEAHVPVGAARAHLDGGDLTIVTWANGLRMSLRVALRLAARGIHARVVDLRWLVPLPVADVLREAEATGRVLVVDETRRSGGVSEGVVTGLVDAGFSGRVARVTSKDSFVPLGAAANLVLVQEDEIEAAALRLVAGS
jgi:2-oxoisovalerate dehydrogenase E1 component